MNHDSSSESDSPLQVSKLDYSFGANEARKQVLFDIDVELVSGELTILFGASGSGKTTLLTLMGCLRSVEQGSIKLFDTELRGASNALLEHNRRRLGFIFQFHNLHESLTAMQNVRMGIEVHGKQAMKQWREAASQLLTTFGLSDHLDYLPSNLSGGQKQRVAVARALVGNPQIIFADEPTAALDREASITVVNMLKGLGRQRATTTLMVTHDNHMLELADRVITMEEGRIIRDER